MKDISRINRNNKNRGRAFERYVADYLGWTRVPYSGAIKEFGGGDVVDGYYQRNGYWVAECKTQQPGPRGSISIRGKWLSQMYGASSGTDRRPILITKNVGASTAFVIMDADTMEFLIAQSGVPIDFKQYSTPTRGKGFNFVIEPEWLDDIGSHVIELSVIAAEESHTFYVMTLNEFTSLINYAGLYIPLKQPEV